MQRERIDGSARNATTWDRSANGRTAIRALECEARRTALSARKLSPRIPVVRDTRCVQAVGNDRFGAQFGRASARHVMTVNSLVSVIGESIDLRSANENTVPLESVLPKPRRDGFRKRAGIVSEPVGCDVDALGVGQQFVLDAGY